MALNNFSASSSELSEVGAYIWMILILMGLALIFTSNSLSEQGKYPMTHLATSLVTIIPIPLRWDLFLLPEILNLNSINMKSEHFCNSIR